jgi:hypothetical protein
MKTIHINLILLSYSSPLKLMPTKLAMALTGGIWALHTRMPPRLVG